MDIQLTRFQQIYKSRALRFGTSVEPASLVQRQNNIKQQRQSSRHNVMMLKRKINEGTFSPIPSPAVTNSKKKQTQVIVEKSKNDGRLEMLRKWQEEKKKRLQKQKTNSKPLFKVHHVSESSQFDLGKIYREIKGKPIVASTTYKFKPPANIKPIDLKRPSTTKKATNVSINRLTSKKKAEVMPTNRVTRSQTVKTVVRASPLQLPIRTRQRKTKNGKNNSAKKNTVNVNTPLSSDNPIISDVNSASTSSSQPVTPLNKCSDSTVYVSPFVTMSRGKDNARKEFHRRSMRGGTDSSDKSTSPKAAAAYFYKLLRSQTDRLRILCHKWTTYKEEHKPAEEACDMIDVAIGQTELLLTKKFQQFKGLVVCCETGNSEKPVTCLDLHGFWDMVMIQVENLNKRFDNLEKLKDNDWEEILPIVKPNQKNKPKKKGSKKSTATGTSSLKAAIQEARRKRGAEGDQSTNTAIFLSGISTVTPDVKRRSSLHRNNLRVSTLTSAAKRSIGSPGLAMIAVTQVAKSAEKSVFDTPIDDEKKTSPKSILKSQKVRSGRRKSKVVLFRESKISSEEEEDQENNPNTSNLIDFTPTNAPRRRSRRLAKGTPFHH